MPVTARGIRTPTLSDDPDVPDDLLKLATDLDDRLYWAQGSIGSIPTPPDPNVQGFMYWATDDLTMGPSGTPYYWNGTIWIMWGTAPGVLPLNDARVTIPGHNVAGIRSHLRPLVLADFTDIGIIPDGLWPLNNVFTDLSGNGLTLTQKGSVPGAPGLDGLANGSVAFSQNGANALYRDDTGVNDPTRLGSGYGSIGCLFRHTRGQNAQMSLITKGPTAAATSTYRLFYSVGQIQFQLNHAGLGAFVTPVSAGMINDSRWHLIIVSWDGAGAYLYIDGVLASYERMQIWNVLASTGPFNLGAVGADAATAGTITAFGNMASAFITRDFINEDQARNLACVAVPHTLGTTPKKVHMTQQRAKRGGTLLTSDIGATPGNVRRLYNMTNGALTDAGADNQPLTVVNTVVASPGPDGARDGARRILKPGSVSYLSASDSGIPSGQADRSYGLWFRTMFTHLTPTTTVPLVSFGGTQGIVISQQGNIAGNGGFGGWGTTDSYVTDGEWHFAIMVHHHTSTDPVKTRAYLDGRMVNGGTTAVPSLSLIGAGGFRIGADLAATDGFDGDVSKFFFTTEALTDEQVWTMWVKRSGLAVLPPSPKDATLHVEAFSPVRILADFQTIPTIDSITLEVPR